jgi:hypothetical protein
MLPSLELLNLAARKNFYVACDVFSSNLNCRYLLVFKGFSDVYFVLTSNKHLNVASNLRSNYTSNKGKDASLLLL